MNMYDKLVYGPLQKHLSPLVVHVPRDVTLGGRKTTFLTANRVTLGRTFLVVPIALCLKLVCFQFSVHWWLFAVIFFRFHCYFSGCMLIILHDFLDHVDGIVAKVHRKYYGLVDSPILGSFLDAFCDKVSLSTAIIAMLLAIYLEIKKDNKTLVIFCSSVRQWL